MRISYTIVAILITWFLGAQVQTSATFTSGDIGTLRTTTGALPNTTVESTCPDTITINIPPGNVVLTTSVVYSMTADGAAWMSEQRSYIECATTGVREATFANGAGNTTGTFPYSRNGLTIANGVSATGQIKFVMHAFKTFGTAGCSIVQNKVNNNSWIVTVTHIPPPTCPFPSNLQSPSQGSSSAFLTWTSGGASNWNIQYGAPGFALGTGTIVSAGSSNFTLNGLNPQTTYQAYVRDSCGLGDVSAWIGPISFTTSCLPSIAPINQTFDPGAWVPGTGFTNAFDAINSCWERTPGGNTGGFGTSQFFWGVGTGSAAFNTGPSSDHTTGTGKYMFVESSLGANGSVADLISRPIDLSPLAVPEMRFWYHMYGAQTGTLTVSIDNGTGWVDVFTLSGQQQTALASPWTEVIIPMASYINDTIKIRFRATKVGTSGDIAIDDLTIDEAPACPQPANLNALAIGSNSVNLDWLAATATSWNLEYGPPGFTPGTGTLIPAGTNPFNLTGLLPNTPYDIYVQENCGPAGVSAFSGPLSVRTNCLPFLAPYLETVDGASWVQGTGFANGGNIIDPCWSRNPIAPVGFVGNFAWGTGQGNPGTINTGPNGDHTSGTGKYVFVESSLGVNASIAELVSPLIDVSPLTSPELRFWYHMYGITTGSISVDINSGSGWVNVWSLSGQQQTSNADLWREAIVGIGAFANDTIQIRFTATKGFGGQGDMAIDDIAVIEAPNCPQPSGNSILAVGSNSVSVDWISGGASNWNISATTVGGNPLSGIIGNATAIPYTLNGLAPNTSYDIYIRDSCAVGDASFWIGPLTIRTNCLPFPTPFIENFEGLSWIGGTGFQNTGDAIDPCFTRNPGPPVGFTGDFFFGTRQGAPAGFNTGPSGDHTTGSGKYIYTESTIGLNGATATFLSPLIDLSNLTVPELRFWYHMYGLQIGSLEVAINDGSGWTVIQTITGQQQISSTTPWLESINPLSAYANDTVQIRWTGTRGFGGLGDMAIDDFSIIEAPTCPQPSLPVASSISFSSVDLSWTSGGASNWNISFGSVGFSPNTGTIVSTSVNPFTLTGLNPSSQYHIYIRDSCGPGSVSPWVGPILVSTLCGPVPAPYLQDFTSTPAGLLGTFPPLALANCWELGASSATALRWETEDATGVNENSFNTGPWFDNTTPSTAGGMYIFLEASTGGIGSTAAFTSPLIITSSLAAPNLSFAYHMYGANIDSLRVDIFSNGVWDNNVWNRFGQQQTSGAAAWLTADVPLSAYGDTIRVRFVGRRGSSFLGDISLDDVSVDEAPACPDPSLLSFLSATATSGTIYWTAGSLSSTTWVIEFGPVGFAPGTGVIVGATNDTATIAGLTSSTTYDLYITEVCPAGAGLSSTIGPLSFNTLCLTASIPYLRDFDSWPPICWDLTGGTVVAPQANGDYMLANYWNWTQPNFALATTEPINISVDARVKFRWSHLYNGGFGPNDQLILQVRLSSSSVWDTLINLIGPTFTSPGAGNTTPAADAAFIQETILLDPALYTSQDVVFQLVMNSGFGTNLYIDDFIVEAIPSCIEPTALSLDQVSTTTAELSWLTGGSTSWQLEYGPAGFTPGTGTIVNALTNPFTITGLTASTSYDFYVRDSCGAGDVSTWEGPVSGSTSCLAFATPYTETFDGASWVTGTGATNANDLIDNCWTRNPNGNFTGGPSVYSWGTGTGPTPSGGTGPTVDNTTGTGNYVYIEASGGGNGNRAILQSPLVDLTGLTNPELEFYYHMFGANVDSLVVKVDDGTSVTTLDFLVGAQQAAQADPWLMRTISLVPYAGSTISIRFESSKLGFAGDIAVDDVSFQSGSACPSPFNLQVTNTGPSSVDLSWTSGGVAGFTQVEYGPVGFTPGTGSVFTATGTTASITGLITSTAYDFYITDSCGASSFSTQVGPVSGTTQCAALVAPYTEDFESGLWTAAGTFDPGTIDGCWTRDNTTDYWWKGSSGATPTVGTGPNGDHTTGSGSYMYTETSSSADLNTEIVSPFIDVSALTSAELRFWYHMYGGLIDELELEVWDGSVWNSELTISGQQQSSQTAAWQESVVDLSSYSGTIQLRFTARRIAGANNQVDISIDDISIDEALSCPNPSAIALTANITTTSVELSWTSGGATSWQIEYGPIGFTPGSGTIVNATSNPFIVTGLSPSSSYHFYVRDSCAAGSVSPWSGPVVGSTQCGTAIAPYFENFDLSFAEGTGNDNAGSTIDPCWTRNPVTGYHWGGGQGGTPTAGTGPTADHTSGFGNYVYAEASFTTPGVTAELETPNVDVTPLTLPELKFWYHMNGANIGKLRVDVFNGTNWTAVDSIVGPQGTAWLERRIVLTAFVNQTIKVRFVSTTGTVPTQIGDIAIDDLSIVEGPSCFVPTNLAVTASTPTSVSLSWTTGGASNWQIEYGPVGFTPGSGTVVNANTNPFTVIGLTAASAYDFYVRDSCGTGDVSIWSGSTQGTTGCATVLAPYSENFDSQFLEGTGNTNANSTINPCWTRSPATGYHWGGGQGTTPTATTGPNGDHTSGNGNYAYVEASFSTLGMRADLETPDIDLSALTYPELSFWYHMLGSSFGALRIDIFDGTAWNIGVDSIVGNQGNTWLERNVNLAAYANQTIKVRFVSRVVNTPTQFGDVAIDDLSIDEGPSCPPPSSLVASAVSNASVTLQWASGGATNWQVEYGPVGFTPGTGTVVSVTTNPFTLTGLNATTAYDVYLRDSCGAGDVSTWVGPLTFTTVNCTSGCFLTLELTDSFGDGWTANNAGTLYHQVQFSVGGGAPTNYTLNNGFSGSFQIPVCDGDDFTVSFLDAGQWQNECGFRLRDPNNVLLFDIPAGALTGSLLLYSDTVDCGGPQLCADPTNLGVQNIGQNSVNLVWNSISGTSRVEFGLAGFALGTGQFIGFIPSTPFNLTGLTPNTNYQYYVQDSCGPGSTSNWVGPFSFTTSNCPAVTANFTFTISNLTVSVNGTSSSGSFFTWSFGTTGTSFDSITTYTFGQEGTYIIKLVNSNGCGSLDSMLVSVDLCAPLTASFTQSTSLLDADFDATGSAGNPTSYAWDFGDGNTGTGLLPSHTYANPGIYTVLLTLTNACNQTDTVTQTLEVCDTVQANFTYTFSGTTFVFDGSASSSNATDWAWDFGDGTIDSVASPTHTFTSGTFNVQLIVTNSCGDDDTVTIPVVVCAKPTAGWTFTIISSGANGMQIQFDASSSIGAVTYNWDFGDGSGNTTSGFPVHTYATPGLFYVVRLIVYNSCGDSDTLVSSLASICIEQLNGDSEQLSLFPNPAKDKVEVDWTGLNSNEEIRVELIDAGGKLIRNPMGTQELGKWHLEMDVSDLPKGTYYLHLRQGTLSRIQRFVKQ